MARELSKGDSSILMPSTRIFEKPSLWIYVNNRAAKWLEVEAALVAFDKFLVVNAETRRHQASVSRLIDGSDHSSARVDGWKCLTRALAEVFRPGRADDSERAVHMKRLLQLGADPDAGTSAAAHMGWTPSHTCAYLGPAQVAKALVPCRPNLGLKCPEGHTPAVTARQMGYPNVAKIFEDAEKNGFPTIAQLAQEKKWWAVHNLCRRGVVPEQEKFALHKGKDAIGWAVQHKEVAIAQELEYLLKGVVQPKYEGLEDKLVALKTEHEKIHAEKELIKKKSDEQAKHLEQMKVDLAVVKKEGEQLKEMLLLNLAETSEDRRSLKKVELLLGIPTKEKNSKRKHDDLQETRNQEFDEPNKRMKANSGGVAQEQEEGPGSKQAACSMLKPGSSKAAAGENGNDKKVAMLEAENKALKESVRQLREAMKTHAAQMNSLLKD